MSRTCNCAFPTRRSNPTPRRRRASLSPSRRRPRGPYLCYLSARLRRLGQRQIIARYCTATSDDGERPPLDAAPHARQLPSDPVRAILRRLLAGAREHSTSGTDLVTTSPHSPPGLAGAHPLFHPSIKHISPLSFSSSSSRHPEPGARGAQARTTRQPTTYTRSSTTTTAEPLSSSYHPPPPCPN